MSRLRATARRLDRLERELSGNPAPSVADTIWGQIGMGTKMACGAREASATGPNGLRFKVARGSWITVTLDPSDTYTVRHCRRSGVVPKVIAEVDDIYAEQLSDVIYGMVNK